MEVLEGITAVHGVAKLAYLLGSTLYDVAKISKDSTEIARRLHADSNYLMGLVKLIESAQLSLTHRCSDDDTSSVIHFIHTEGVVELLHAQCEELTTALQDHQAIISTHQTAIGSDPNFRQRFLATWKRRNRLVPKMNELQPQLEGLKSSLQLIVQLIHLESSSQGRDLTQANRSNTLETEIARLREEIQAISHQFCATSHINGAQQGITTLSPQTSLLSFFTARETSLPRESISDSNDTEMGAIQLVRRSSDSTTTVSTIQRISDEAYGHRTPNQSAECHQPDTSTNRSVHSFISSSNGNDSNISLVTPLEEEADMASLSLEDRTHHLKARVRALEPEGLVEERSPAPLGISELELAADSLATTIMAIVEVASNAKSIYQALKEASPFHEFRAVIETTRLFIQFRLPNGTVITDYIRDQQILRRIKYETHSLTHDMDVQCYKLRKLQGIYRDNKPNPAQRLYVTSQWVHTRRPKLRLLLPRMEQLESTFQIIMGVIQVEIPRSLEARRVDAPL